MKQTTIDRDLLPNMWLNWQTTKGEYYLECATGTKFNKRPNVEFGWYRGHEKPNESIAANSKPRYAYAKYHEDIERLELAEVTIDTTRSENVKNWSYAGNKYFLGKDKSVVDENGNIVTSNFNLSRYHVGRNFKEFLSMLYRISYDSHVITEFKKFLGSDKFVVASGRVVNVCSAWHIREWYQTSQKVRGPGKQQKLTDMLTEMPVTDIEQLNTKYPHRHHPTWNDNIIYLERLIDGWSVLRVFKRNIDGHLMETERMYLHDNGANRIVSPTEKGWVPARQFITWNEYELVNKNEAMEKCKRLQYIIPLVQGSKKTRIRNQLMTILRFPELEQMINMGYSSQAEYVLNNNTAKADLKAMFGNYYNEKESTILRKAGLTKHQFDKVMSVRATGISKSERALKEMRKMFGDGLIHLDNDTFDNYYSGFVAMDRGLGREPFTWIDNLGVDRDKFIKNVFNG